MIPRKKLLSASLFCWTLFLLLVVASLTGCASRHLPGGGTQPATPYEQVMTWNAALAQANDGFADSVITLQRAGELSIEQTKNILLAQGRIAQADMKITERLRAGSEAAKTSSAEMQQQINVILGAISDLNGGLLLGVKNEDQRRALTITLVNIQSLANQIFNSLRSQGLISRGSFPRVEWS